MDTLILEIKSEAQTGRVQIGDVIAIYEQHTLVSSAKMDFLRVSFFRKTTVQVQLFDGGMNDEEQELSMNADIEYSSEAFHCRIKEQENPSMFWDIFWAIFNQLKLVE